MTRKLIVISAGYLDAFMEQLPEYSLELCLFGSGVSALKNLPCINKLNLLGCIIVDPVIDKATLKECLPVLKTLQSIYNVPVTVAFNSLENKSIEAALAKVPNVTLLPFELLTDDVVNKCVQSILVQKQIYKLKEVNDVTASRLPRQSLHQLLSADALKVLKPVVNTNSYQSALLYEKVTGKSTLERLRKGMIASKYNAEVEDLSDIYAKSPSLFETLYAKYLIEGGADA